jgi:phosphoenolpyruvate-protein phosphotransferase
MRRIQGLPVSDGVAIGPAWLYRPTAVTVERRQVTDPQAEWVRLQAALAVTRTQLQALHARARGSVGEAEAAIFEAHQLILEDPEFLTAVRMAIETHQLNAEAAVSDAIEHYAQALLALEAAYFQARAQDVRDVGGRIIRCLVGHEPDQASGLTWPVIVLADDLTPSDTIQLDQANVLGLCTVRGGPTSHTAILARGLGVPAVVSAPIPLDEINAGTELILDGTAGAVTIDPTSESLALARRQRAEWLARRVAQLSTAAQPATTRDGHTVEVVANIGSAEEARRALEQGAEGVGLFRTEFLYLNRDRLPGEAEQIAAYRDVVEIIAGRPLVVRTLDIGGDKAVSYLGIRAEPNPFLGWRGIRTISERPDILHTQFRALLQAGVGADLRLMVPMVSCLEEVLQARELLAKAREGLAAEGRPLAEKVQFGIMIEVPSAALLAEHLAPYVDFFSIGTNDLTQYTLAVDRTNERVAALASPYHPAVLRLMAQTIQAAHAQGKWVGLCGELAGDPEAVPLLLGFGLDEFSMASAAIPAVKAAIRNWSLAEARALADTALAQATTAQVKALLRERALAHATLPSSKDGSLHA